VNFTVVSKNLAKAEIILEMNFEDPSKISAGDVLDMLQVRVTDLIDIQRDNWRSVLKKQIARKNIPP